MVGMRSVLLSFVVVVAAPCVAPRAKAILAQNPFIRGEANQDGQFNVADPVFTVGYLFLGLTPPSCDDAADSNDDGQQNIADVVFSLNFLFGGGSGPPAPFPDCGIDPTADNLGCGSFPPCGGAEIPILTRPSRSSTIAITANDRWVVMTNPDDASVSVFFTPNDELFSVIPTGREPSSVVIHPDNRTAFVANRADGTVVRVSDFVTTTPVVSAPTEVGAEPVGLALTPTGSTLFVAEYAEGRVSVIDTESMEVVGAIEAPRHPRALTVTNDGDQLDDDELVIVPEFFGEPGPGPEATDTSRTGRVRIYRVADLSPEAPIVLSPIDSGIVPQGTAAGTVMTSPNQLYSVSVDEGRVYVTSISASPSPPVVFNGNVYPVVYVGDLGSRQEDRSPGGTTNLARKVADALPPGETRFFLSEIVDMVLAGSGGEFYAVARGADVLQRVVFTRGGVIIGSQQNVQVDLLAFADGSVCQAPIGVTLDSAGTRAYVNCWVSRRLGVVDLASQTPQLTVQSTAPPAAPAEQAVQRGKRFFFTGRARWSSEAWSSCGSCHPDGLTDNITWSFAAGPRQTISMDGSFSPNTGGVQEQRVFNWTAIFDEIHDFERNTRGVSGGKGAVTVAGEGSQCGDIANEVQLALQGGLAQPVREVQDDTPACTDNWNDIEAFSKTIRAPRARRLLDAESVARGRQVFEDGGCAECHGGPSWTISRLFFVPSSSTNAELAAAGEIRPQPADADDTSDVIGPPEVACVLRDAGTFGIPGDDAATASLERNAGGARSQGRGGFNPPSLFGVSLGAPFLHHGQAGSLEELFTDPLWEDHLRAGNAAFLTGTNADQERLDLINFLLSIDETTPIADTVGGSCP